jgi:hypothetical protein
VRVGEGGERQRQKQRWGGGGKEGEGKQEGRAGFESRIE